MNMRHSIFKVSALAALLVLMGCKDAFTEAIEEKFDPDSSTNGEIDPAHERVPILASVTDPMYSLVNEGGATTRGVGAFDSWLNSSEKWMGSHMSIYAFRTGNYADGDRGVASYEKSSDINDCLLWNDSARVVANGILQFYDTDRPRYYNQYHQDYRYKFYISHLDDAVASDVKVDGKVMTQNVTIDGTQDLMVGFAYHTDEEIEKHVERLVKNGYANDEEVRVLNNFKQELTYSTIAGHRALHPLFHLRHLTTRFNVQIVGRFSSSNEAKIPYYRNILVTGIDIESPDGGVVTIANDKWTSDNFQTMPNDELFRPYTDASHIKMFRPAILEQIFTDPIEGLDLPLAEASQEQEDLINILKAYGKPVPEHVWQCNSHQTAQSVVDDILLPVQGSYKFRLRYYYIDRLRNDDGTFRPEIVDKSSIYDMTGEEQATEYQIVPTPAINNKFEPGKKYVLQLSIYGLEKIQLSVASLDLWQDGGSAGIFEPWD